MNNIEEVLEEKMNKNLISVELEDPFFGKFITMQKDGSFFLGMEYTLLHHEKVYIHEWMIPSLTIL